MADLVYDGQKFCPLSKSFSYVSVDHLFNCLHTENESFYNLENINIKHNFEVNIEMTFAFYLMWCHIHVKRDVQQQDRNLILSSGI